MKTFVYDAPPPHRFWKREREGRRYEVLFDCLISLTSTSVIWVWRGRCLWNVDPQSLAVASKCTLNMRNPNFRLLYFKLVIDRALRCMDINWLFSYIHCSRERPRHWADSGSQNCIHTHNYRLMTSSIYLLHSTSSSKLQGSWNQTNNRLEGILAFHDFEDDDI